MYTAQAAKSPAQSQSPSEFQLISRDSENNHSWGSDLKRLLPLLGHRNWIVVADAAYPAQSNPGIETIASEADHLPVVKATLEAIQNSKHVRANI
jgi:L-fucose mutarotase/ribose pyranase (RbsD/FucU family)